MTALLAVLIVLILYYLRGVGPRQALYLSQLRRLIIPKLDKRFSDDIRQLTIDKTDNQKEYICTYRGSQLDLLIALWKYGFRWNPVSMVKYIRMNEDKKYAMSVVYRQNIDSERQQDIHIFPNKEIWGHYEDSVTDPEEHLDASNQVPGDPKNILHNALKIYGIKCTDETIT